MLVPTRPSTAPCQMKTRRISSWVAPNDMSTAMLRRFCRVRGIPLPYRPDPRDGAKGPGLAAALRELAQKSFGPMSIVVVTDIDGLGDPGPMLQAVKLLRLHGHDVSFVVHDGTSFAPAPGSALEKDLFAVYGRGERRRGNFLSRVHA